MWQGGFHDTYMKSLWMFLVLSSSVFGPDLGCVHFMLNHLINRILNINRQFIGWSFWLPSNKTSAGSMPSCTVHVQSNN